MYFWTYGLRKTWLDKCLKSPASEDASRSNMVNGAKHCWNLNGSTFTLFVGHCESNSVGKSLPWQYAKYYDCLLTYWLPMTSILFLIETIYCNLFKCNYLRIKKFCFNFFLHFPNLDWILNIFEKKDDSHRWCIFELTVSKQRG